MTQELKPCPFCGTDGDWLILTEHEPHTHKIATFMPDYPGSATIECPGCNVGMIDDTKEKVIAAWNRRQTASATEFKAWIVCDPFSGDASNLLESFDTKEQAEEWLQEKIKEDDDGYAGCVVTPRAIALAAYRYVSDAPNEAKDAARYHWLRERFKYDHITHGRNGYHYDADPIPGDGMGIDEAIDAAIESDNK